MCDDSYYLAWPIGFESSSAMEFHRLIGVNFLYIFFNKEKTFSCIEGSTAEGWTSFSRAWITSEAVLSMRCFFLMADNEGWKNSLADGVILFSR